MEESIQISLSNETDPRLHLDLLLMEIQRMCDAHTVLYGTIKALDNGYISPACLDFFNQNSDISDVVKKDPNTRDLISYNIEGLKANVAKVIESIKELLVKIVDGFVDTVKYFTSMNTHYQYMVKGEQLRAAKLGDGIYLTMSTRALVLSFPEFNELMSASSELTKLLNSGKSIEHMADEIKKMKSIYKDNRLNVDIPNPQEDTLGKKLWTLPNIKISLENTLKLLKDTASPNSIRNTIITRTKALQAESERITNDTSMSDDVKLKKTEELKQAVFDCRLVLSIFNYNGKLIRALVITVMRVAKLRTSL